jgi:hypothetical protein
VQLIIYIVVYKYSSVYVNDHLYIHVTHTYLACIL